jgi:hypothetical protein
LDHRETDRRPKVTILAFGELLIFLGFVGLSAPTVTIIRVINNEPEPRLITGGTWSSRDASLIPP